MAQKLHIEDLVLNVLVNGDPARKKMLDLANQIKDDNSKLKEMQQHFSGIEKMMGKGSDAYKKQVSVIKLHKESIDANRKALKGMQGDLKTDVLTIGELKDRIKDLSNRLRDIAPGTEEWKRFNARLQETKARLKELQNQGVKTEGVLKRFWSSAAGAVAMVQAGWVVLIRFVNGLRSAFDTLKDFEQANVSRTGTARDARDPGSGDRGASRRGLSGRNPSRSWRYLRSP